MSRYPIESKVDRVVINEIGCIVVWFHKIRWINFTRSYSKNKVETYRISLQLDEIWWAKPETQS